MVTNEESSESDTEFDSSERGMLNNNDSSFFVDNISGQQLKEQENLDLLMEEEDPFLDI